MALESVDYSEEKACQILNIVMQEENGEEKKTEEKNGEIVENNDVVPETSEAARYVL